GLPENFRRAGLLAADAAADALPQVGGAAAVIAGSASAATLAQVAQMRATHPAFAIDPLALAEERDVAADILAAAAPKLGAEPVLIYASAPPEEVKRVQEELGRERAGALIEQALARIAAGLVERGVRRLVVAGGETAGAVVQALGVRALRIGP